MKIISLFSGAGGLDLGFKLAGFNIIWANDVDKATWDTFEYNFPETKLDKRSIINIPSSEIPNPIGIIGGPPCQSWSEAGAQRGINDERGKLFFEYIRVLKDKQPLFFLAENVSGILHKKHGEAIKEILDKFEEAGYFVNYALLNAKYYNVPQDRKRVFFIGYHKNIGKSFNFIIPVQTKTLKDTIWDLRNTAKPAKDKNKKNNSLEIPNHEYMNGGFSTIYMSRNRVRNWDEQSYTIQAGGRHAPIHPQAPKMECIGKDHMRFVPGKEPLYRRLSVRECARIQTFPDSFIFKYNNVSDGYKLVGNAVPVELARRLAIQIYKDIKDFQEKDTKKPVTYAR
jgi:DNA (cytosine-5)-methyltransferase 1